MASEQPAETLFEDFDAAGNASSDSEADQGESIAEDEERSKDDENDHGSDLQGFIVSGDEASVPPAESEDELPPAAPTVDSHRIVDGVRRSTRQVRRPLRYEDAVGYHMYKIYAEDPKEGLSRAERDGLLARYRTCKAIHRLTREGRRGEAQALIDRLHAGDDIVSRKRKAHEEGQVSSDGSSSDSSSSDEDEDDSDFQESSESSVVSVSSSDDEAVPRRKRQC